MDPRPLPVPRPSVVACDVADGTILLSLEDETYYSLTAVGARIWALLRSTQSFDGLVDALAAEFADVDPSLIRTDAAAFLDEMRAAGLIDEAPRPA
jgi:hypothetical protein